MKKNLGQRGVFLGRVVIVEVDAGVGERLVGRCKHRERPCSLEGRDQIGVRQGRYQGIVDTRCRSVCGNVLAGVSSGAERKGGGSEKGDNQEGNGFVHEQRISSVQL